MEVEYPKAGVLFAILVLAVLIFGGLYSDLRITLISLPLLVFLVVLFLGWSSNQKLDKGEMRRAITAALVSTFMVIVLGSQYLSIPPELRDYFLGVLSTIIGFYFGYRGRENEEERMERIIQGLGGGD
ncbi:hypothetical protein JCM16138_04890 [Thermococcus atlanticus]